MIIMNDTLLNDSITNGIFTLIESYGDFGFLGDYDREALNLMYYNRSGLKPISPFTERILNNDKLDLSSGLDLYNALYAMYNKNWEHLHNALLLEYAPIENYNMEESGTDTYTGTEKNTGSGTNENIGKLTGSVNDNTGVYGFNSIASVNSDKAESTSESSNTATTTETRNFENTNENTTTHKLTRHGNIGVTTSQQMLQSELDIWTSYNFIEQVFKDIDRLLTLPIY